MNTIKLQCRVLLNRINYDISNDLTYIRNYFLAHYYDITFISQKVDLHGYSVTEVKNPMGNYQYVLQGGSQSVKSLLTKDDDIAVLVIQGSKEFGVKCPSESEDKLFIPGTTTVFCCANADDEFYDAPPNFRIWFMHEIMHALGTLSGYAGHPIEDCMDVLRVNGHDEYYYLNYSPENPNSNFINQFERLYPWLASQPMNVTIKRNKDDGKETLGTLTITQNNGDIWSCSTMELPWKNNQHDISCIPTGTYQCTWSPFHDTFHYELQGTSPRTGIFIHPMNYYTDSEGCIGLGQPAGDINKDNEQDISNSQATIAKFESFFNKKPFTITIM